MPRIAIREINLQITVGMHVLKYRTREWGLQHNAPYFRPALERLNRNPPKGTNRMDVLRILIAILLPPLGVFLEVGIGMQFWLNILLTILGYVPGIIHAIYIIASRS